MIKEKIEKYLPKLLYWKRATWTRSQWFCYDIMKFFLKYKNSSEYPVLAGKKNIQDNQTIWIYWHQGENNAPDIVKRCIASIKEHAGNHPVIILNKKTLQEYVKIPEFIEEKLRNKKISNAHYSDLVRITLLIAYGGYWFDATCFMTAGIPEIIEDAPFFMFSRDLLIPETSPCEGSNWFIKSEKGNPALIRLRNILLHYYSKYSWVPDYYIFHITLGLLIHTDNEISEIWNRKPYMCNMNPHLLLFSFHSPYNKAYARYIKSSSFIQKLTYKYKTEDIKEGSFLSFFLNNHNI